MPLPGLPLRNPSEASGEARTGAAEPDWPRGLPPALERAVRLLVAAKAAFLAVACLVMASTLVLVVVLRYGFSADLFAYEEWLLVICFWLYFAGGALGTYERSHVTADLLSHAITDRRLAWIRRVLVTGVEAAVCAAVNYWAGLMIIDEVASYPRWQTTIALQIPFLVPRLGMFAGFLLMGFYSSLQLYVLLWHRGAPPDYGTPGRRPAGAEP